MTKLCLFRLPVKLGRILFAILYASVVRINSPRTIHLFFMFTACFQITVLRSGETFFDFFNSQYT